MRILKLSHSADDVKGGPLGHFKLPICCKMFKQIEGDSLETLKNFRIKSFSAEETKLGTF